MLFFYRRFLPPTYSYTPLGRITTIPIQNSASLEKAERENVLLFLSKAELWYIISRLRLDIINNIVIVYHQSCALYKKIPFG